MDDKIKEIEEIKKYIKGEYEICGERASHHTEIQRLETLLSKIKELETALDITAGALEGSQGVVRELKERIKELEEYIKLITKKSGVWVKELEKQLKHSRISDEDLTKLFEGGEDG